MVKLTPEQIAYLRDCMDLVEVDPNEDEKVKKSYLRLSLQIDKAFDAGLSKIEKE